MLKSNKDDYEEHKRKERDRKRLANHRKNFAINHPHLVQEPSQTSFSNSAVISRPNKKVEKSLPQSPRKKKEVIKSLASKFNVKVKFRQKLVLSEQENQ